MDPRQHRSRHPEDAQQFLVPVQRLEIHQHGAAGVGHVGDVDSGGAVDAGAAGQIPGDPAVHRAEQQLATVRAVLQLRLGIQQPAQLRRREVVVQRQSRPHPDLVRVELPLDPGQQRAGPGVLPDDRLGDRMARSRIPDHRRLALVGDAERDDLVRTDPRLGERLRQDPLDDGPDLGRIVLHPAGPRKVPAVLPLGDRHHPALPVEDHAAGRRRALVDGRDIAGGSPFAAVTEFAGDRPAGPDDVRDQGGARSQPVVTHPVDRTLDADGGDHVAAAVPDRAPRYRRPRARPRPPSRPSRCPGRRPVPGAGSPDR